MKIKCTKDYEKRFYDFCKKINFDDEYAQNLLKLVSINKGKINATMIRGHFPISWAVSARIVDGMTANKLADPMDLTLDKTKLLPPEDRSGWLKGTD